MPARPRIGDVFEFATPCGLAYLQYAQDDPEYGSLARVMEGLHGRRPVDLSRWTTRFVVFIPIASAVRAGDLTFVTALEVPVEDASPRIFREPLGLDGSKHGWAFRQAGKDLGKRRQLTIEERLIPVWEIWTFGLLVERVASDWSWTNAYGPAPRPAPGRARPCFEGEGVAGQERR